MVIVTGDVTYRGRRSVGIWSFRSTRVSKNAAGGSALTILRRSYGTRFPMRSMRWALVGFWQALRTNGIIKNDIEYILFERKPGDTAARILR